MERNRNLKLSDIRLNDLLRILREGVLLVLVALILYHLIRGDIAIELPDLSASELVSIFLAFFAIALAVSFYFAATSQSNDFYNNVNRFTKETSEILGRLDEQVKNLGGRQSELKDSIDKYYFGSNNEKLEEAQQSTEAQVEEVNENISQIIRELFDKAQLDTPEREQFERRIREKDQELGELRERLGRIAMRSERPVRHYTRSRIQKLGLEEAISESPRSLLFKIARRGPASYRRDLHALGYINSESIESESDITKKGENLVVSELHALLEEEGKS